MNLKNYLRDIYDFPKKGIVFKDITPLLGDASAFNYAAKALLDLVNSREVDVVVGVESRGFFFGSILARDLNARFVPVRKQGKLPFDTVSETFTLEYGTDTLEMHKDAIQPGDKVLLHDDVLATGGTAVAVVNLIEKLGGEVVQCNFLIELTFLKGRDHLNNKKVAAAITF